MEEKDSSNSNQDEYFDQLQMKKVSFDGQISDSGDQSHSSQSNYRQNKTKRNNYSKQINNLLKAQSNENQLVDQDKTKIIKKNCVSAKMSRQRKKIYIELLQKKVDSLKKNILQTRQKLKVNRSKVMHYIHQSNRQKRVYIQEKMKDSKRLIALSEQFTYLTNATKNIQIKKNQLGNVVYLSGLSQNQINNSPQNLQPTQIPPQMQMPLTHSMVEQSINQKNIPTKKSKKTLKINPQETTEHLFKQLQEKKELLQLGINSYLYKFGINGILKNDVVQLLKQKWYQLVIDESVLDAGKANQLEKVICDFRDCFWQIDQSNKKLDYLLRQLRDKIKPQFVVKFILQKQFFKSFSSNPSIQIKGQGFQNNISEMKEEKQQQQDEQVESEFRDKKRRKDKNILNDQILNDSHFISVSESIRQRKQAKKKDFVQIYQDNLKNQEIDFQLDL